MRVVHRAVGWLLAMTCVGRYSGSHVAAQEARRVVPVLAATQMYDSNLFLAQSGVQSDFITRFSPGLEVESRTRRFNLVGRYGVDLERFASQTALSSAAAGQHAAVTAGHSLTRRVAIAVDAGFTRTQTPGELSAATGLTLARTPATRTEIHPSVVRRLSPIAEATIDYTWTDERLIHGLATVSHAAGIALDRHASPTDTWRVSYGVRTFKFDSAGVITSNAFDLGWSRQITRLTRVELRGGPVLTTGGVVAPEAVASIVYRPDPSELSIAYARAQTTLIGFDSTVDAQSVTASASFRARPTLQLRVVPGVFRTTHGNSRADVARLLLEAEQRLSTSFSVRTTYETTLQRGNLGNTLANSISRHVVRVSVVAEPGARRSRGH